MLINLWVSVSLLTGWVWGGSVKLTKHNIGSVIQENDIVMLNFYADWCRWGLQPAGVWWNLTIFWLFFLVIWFIYIEIILGSMDIVFTYFVVIRLRLQHFFIYLRFIRQWWRSKKKKKKYVKQNYHSLKEQRCNLLCRH